ncbi:hypothetical protein DdX_10213 [Ditylenchus destructor]|uniref:Uncharacterized protein n=1 Tax=Ditylenchus destructor TaxID=166010 RepID=A0AAD4R5E5_9BILA|nr:hypothetical protein DdX_10213 [Ditylenchus destructor]
MFGLWQYLSLGKVTKQLENRSNKLRDNRPQTSQTNELERQIDNITDSEALFADFVTAVIAPVIAPKFGLAKPVSSVKPPTSNAIVEVLWGSKKNCVYMESGENKWKSIDL